MFAQKVQKDTISYYYDASSAVLLSDLQNKEIASQLTAYDEILEIEVHSYTDFRGDWMDNYELSKERANNVRTYLRQIYDGRVVVAYHGEVKVKDTSLYPDGIKEHHKVRLQVYYKGKSGKIQFPKEQNYLQELADLVPGQSIILKNTQFFLGKSQILPNSYDDLENLYTVMQENPDLEIEIRGHVCCGGKQKEGDEEGEVDYIADTNWRLSQNRASVIRKWLVNKGIDKKRIGFKGMAFKEPLFFPEKNEKERQANRRVELRVIKNKTPKN